MNFRNTSPGVVARDRKARTARFVNRAFTLIELLVVMAIIVLMSVLVAPAVSGIKAGGDLTSNSYEISNTLEQARAYAIGKNTYVWVGFFEEDANALPPAAGAAAPEGIGTVIMSVVASNDGTRLYPTRWPTQATETTSLLQLGKLVVLNNAHLDVLKAEDITAPDLMPADGLQVGSSAFETNGSNTGAGPFSFHYPLGGGKYTLKKIVEFNPQGDATNLGTPVAPLIGIGLHMAHGNVADPSPNRAAILVDGIGGSIRVHRP